MDLHFKNNIEEQLQQKDILNDVALSVLLREILDISCIPLFEIQLLIGIEKNLTLQIVHF